MSFIPFRWMWLVMLLCFGTPLAALVWIPVLGLVHFCWRNEHFVLKWLTSVFVRILWVVSFLFHHKLWVFVWDYKCQVFFVVGLLKSKFMCAWCIFVIQLMIVVFV